MILTPFILSHLLLKKPNYKPKPREGSILAVAKPIESLQLMQPLVKIATEPTIAPLPVASVTPVHVSDGTDLYAPGQCTYGVKLWRPDIPNNWGNANMWFYNARADGWATGHNPKAGAVAQTTGDSWWGHVALVEAVYSDGSFLIQEMNNGRPWVIGQRLTSTAEFPNFIY